MLVDKKNGTKLHGIADIFSHFAEDQSSRDSIRWLLNSYQPNQLSHNSYLLSLYSPASLNLANIIAYRTLKQANTELQDEKLDFAINDASPDIKKLEQQAGSGTSEQKGANKKAENKVENEKKQGDAAQKTVKVPKKKTEDIPE